MKRHTRRVTNNPASPWMARYRREQERRDCIGWFIACLCAAVLLCAVLHGKAALERVETLIPGEVAK